MFTALDYRYAPGPEPPLIPALRVWLGGWPLIGRIGAGRHARAARWPRHPSLHRILSPPARPGSSSAAFRGGYLIERKGGPTDDRNQNVTLSFNAFDRRGMLEATARTDQLFAPAGRELNVRASLVAIDLAQILSFDCDEVKRHEIKEIKVECA